MPRFIRIASLSLSALVLNALALHAALAQDADWQAIGAETYAANCAACHQAEGQGIPAAFPPLAGHAPLLVAAEGGREYLIKVLLYGLQGEITVLEATYNGVMPPWPQLSDEQVAAVINHTLHAWGNDALLPEGFEPVSAEEVAAQRELGLSPAQVHELRAALELE